MFGGLFHGLHLGVALAALDLPFNTMSSGSDLTAKGVTFTRSGNAMMYDSTGKLTWLPNNLLTNSGSQNDWSLIGTTQSTATGAGPSGQDVGLLVEDTSSGRHTIIYGTTPDGVTSIVSCYVKRGVGSRNLNMGLSSGGGGATFDLAGGTAAVAGGQIASAGITSVGGGWFRAWITVKSTAGACNMWIGLMDTADATGLPLSYTGDGASSLYLGLFQLERVTYQTTPRPYIATTSAVAYGPRFDFDPATLSSKGLLTEESRTNLAQQNLYGAEYADIAASDITSPDGTVSGRKVVQSTATGTSQAIQYTIPSGTVSSGVVHAPSLYLKMGTQRYVVVLYTTFSTSETWATCVVDLQIGVITQSSSGASATAQTPTITPVGNGWFRVSTPATLGAHTANIVIGAYGVSSGTPTLGSYGRLASAVAGDGSSYFYTFGAQLELGSFATSYIPTTTASVTRAAETCSITGSAFSSFYNQSEGTFVLDAAYEGLPTGQYVPFLTVGDGNYDNSLRFLRDVGGNTLNYDAWSGGSQVANFSGPTTVVGAFTKGALAYKVNDFAASFSGGTVQTDSLGAVPTAATQAQFGGYTSTLGEAAFWIKSLQYYNTRKTNAELVSLTT